jgi:hypothetical protein
MSRSSWDFLTAVGCDGLHDEGGPSVEDGAVVRARRPACQTESHEDPRLVWEDDRGSSNPQGIHVFAARRWMPLI